MKKSNTPAVCWFSASIASNLNYVADLKKFNVVLNALKEPNLPQTPHERNRAKGARLEELNELCSSFGCLADSRYACSFRGSYKEKMMTQPAPFQRYLDLAPETDCYETLKEQFVQLFPCFQGMEEEKTTIVHPPYAWTIKQIVGHLIDTERVFTYRALRFARADTTPLPGFDQDLFMQEANFNQRPYHELVQEFMLVRQGTIEMFRTFPEEAFEREGNASGFPWTVRQLGRCMVGHVRHHWQIVEQRLAHA